MKKNCWEFTRCGREPGGPHDNGDEKCRVPLMAMYDGIHGGINGGRVCWIVSGSVCEGETVMAFSEKVKSCSTCEFYLSVLKEEGETMPLSLKSLETLVGRIKSD